VFGYGGKQVRDNIHGEDLARAFLAFHASPRAGAVYNMGGGRTSNCSMLEAIDACERIAGKSLESTLSDEPRKGDHRWWISDVSEFEADYPAWSVRSDVDAILHEIYEQNAERWSSGE
jgi:CDP-paratose 2-epimerase